MCQVWLEVPGYKTVWNEKPRRDNGKGYYQYESQWVPVLESKTQDVFKAASNLQGLKLSNGIAEKLHSVQVPRPLTSSGSSALSLKLVWLLEEDIYFGIQSLGPFLSHIPSRLGHNKALDDATDCICSTYISIFEPAGCGNNTNLHKYLLGLKSLRQCILNKSQALTSNVLAAAVLMSWYEILAGNLENGWLAHIRGCSKLIQARGPSRYHAEFDRALLYAQQGFVSTEALISSIPSFLDSPAWQSALNDSERKYHSNDLYLESLNTINRRVSRLSTVISECRNLDHCIRQKTHTVAKIRAVLKRYRDLRGEVKDHLEQENLMAHIRCAEQPRSIITAKIFLALMNLDAHLYSIMHLLTLPSSSSEFSLQHHLAAVYTKGEEDPFLRDKKPKYYPPRIDTSTQVSLEIISPSNPPFPNYLSNSLILAHLNASIAHSSMSLKQHLLILRQANPFCFRRMTFFCHMVFAETRKRGAMHTVWGEMEDWFEGINRESCLS